MQPFVVPPGGERRKRNAFEKAFNGYTPGTIFGYLFLLFTICFITLEVARIFTGSLNRSEQLSYRLYPGNIYLPPYFIMGQTFNVERQHHYLWPWSHPILFFSIPLFLAALFGISSGRRGTYSTIYLFFTFSLITFWITPFLIGYYSVNINRHNSGVTQWERISSANRDRSFSIVLLILCILLLIISAIATIISAIGYSIGVNKGGSFLRPSRFGNQIIGQAPMVGAY